MEIEKREYDRLKSREEKLMHYYERYEKEGVKLPEIEDVITRSIELKKEKEELESKYTVVIGKAFELGKLVSMRLHINTKSDSEEGTLAYIEESIGDIVEEYPELEILIPDPICWK